MVTEFLTGQDLKKMLSSGLVYLEEKYKEIDSLNVFPVPDGDTGTNMYLTLAAAVKETEAVNDQSSVSAVAEAASQGALMGARGNSGVILSQLMRGLARGLKNMDSVPGKVFAKALDEGTRVAYLAVIKPVEGTILTVAREAAKEAQKAARLNQPLPEVLQAACQAAEETLNRTPDMLPALREAGVVDAGGMGWLIILQGFCGGLLDDRPTVPAKTRVEYARPAAAGIASGIEADLEFPYCTEVLIKSGGMKTEGLKNNLLELGDSLMIVDSDGLVRVHIHSAHPGVILETCLKYGSLTDIKINNMNEQKAKTAFPKAKKTFGVVAVAAGEGLKNIMTSLGADRVITGGQTMNPSIQELVQAVEDIEAGTVIILPNNSNILLTANQVGSLTGKQVKVIPTRTVPQGLAALVAIPAGAEVKKVVKSMQSSLGRVKTGEVTYAVRDTKIDGQEIKKGSIIGLFNDKIVQTGSAVREVVSGLLERMITPADEICTLYSGEMIADQEAQDLVGQLAEKFSQVEFELHSGGQPLYYYIISVE